MIGVVYGTTGELIKLAPVLLEELRARGHRPLLLCTGQQRDQLPLFAADLGLPDPDVWLAEGHRGHDLDRKREIPGWAATAGRRVIRGRRALRRMLAEDGHAPFLLVHGDTLTTVVGALAGRVLGVPVGHVEAGMRSGDWRNPFPEELNRRIAARLIDVHFAPGPRPVANLRRERARGTIVDTGQNTIRDAVDLVADRAADRGPAGRAVRGGLRPPLRADRARGGLPEPARGPARALRNQPLLFVDHSTTAAVVERSPRLVALFDERFRRIPRQPYVAFIGLLKAADFLVTDSGGCQEECAFLGLPCLIHRTVSEHDTGLDTSVVLSLLDMAVVRRFLADPGRWRSPPEPAAVRPSAIIVDELAPRRGAV